MKHNFVKVFHTTPIFKFLIPLIAGIVTSQITVFSTSITITFILISLLSAFYFTIKQNYYTPGWYYSMLLFFFSLGIGIVKIHTYNNWNIENFRESIYWIGEVRSLAEPTAYGQRYKLRILYYKKDEQWKASKINVLLYIKRNLNIEPEPGQYVCLSEKIHELFIPPSSDHTQSYKNYLTQNIVGKIFIDSRDDILPMPFRSNNLNSQIQLFRNNILKQTGSFFKSTDEKSIFHSLFFGYRSEMDTELTNAYATAGVIHILSVSGLHVGIVYLFLMFITKLLQRKFLLQLIRVLIIILAIWFYGLIAGFSPPVVRSCCMFTLLGITQILQRELFPYNSLFLSAFIILLFDPFQLYDIGFQLSYSAMLGIFTFYRPITKAMNAQGYLSKKIIELIAVSLAAQLGTLPLTLYYFNSFPSYFLLSNLIIVPFASIIMYSGIVFLSLTPFPVLAEYSAQFLAQLIEWLNKMVMLIEQLPYASLKNIYLNRTETVILVLIILSLAYLINYRNLRALPLLLILIIIFQISSIVKIFRGYTANHIIFSQINKTPLITYIHQNQAYCIMCDSSKYLDRNISNIMKDYYVNKINFHQLAIPHAGYPKNKHIIKIANHEFLIYPQKTRTEKNEELLMISTPKYRVMMVNSERKKTAIRSKHGYNLINLD